MPFPTIDQYNEGIPEGSRLHVEQDPMFKRKIEFLKSDEGQKQINIVRKLTELAEKGSFHIPVSLLTPELC